MYDPFSNEHQTKISEMQIYAVASSAFVTVRLPTN